MAKQAGEGAEVEQELGDTALRSVQAPIVTRPRGPLQSVQGKLAFSLELIWCNMASHRSKRHRQHGLRWQYSLTYPGAPASGGLAALRWSSSLGALPPHSQAVSSSPTHACDWASQPDPPCWILSPLFPLPVEGILVLRRGIPLSTLVY
jgi:hypothetical protein